MPANLSVQPVEGGGFGVVAEFFDDRNDPVVPKTLDYSLVNKYGTVVNEKQNVTLTPQEKVTVALGPDDLVPGEKHFIINGTYDSVDLGNDTVLRDYVTFIVDDVPG